MKDSNVPISNNFGTALQTARVLTRMPQEAFSEVSSRTYVSALERHLKSPTLQKVDDLSAVMGLHPLTLLSLAYCEQPTSANIKLLLKTVEGDLRRLMIVSDESADSVR